MITTATQTPLEVRTPIPNETETSRPLPSLPPVVASSATPAPKKSAAPTAAGFSSDAIADSQSYSPEVRKIVDLSLELAAKNLSYKYVSADPANGDDPAYHLNDLDELVFRSGFYGLRVMIDTSKVNDEQHRFE